ncbi:Rho guanyl nucleotide exchange [Niveomyces insectorum RCEF 264]|uniref:Rho guanyl nucleotide exchange n=1 Tax=Niveomyces insectorum RCEF 264 TaxID=1081102 RepID=A0A167PVM0_9HYPO|nr:Rho guanyl nucleotide exchange [Niveomyces insectorum RCEF 264]
MVRVTDELALSPEAVTLYYASDPLLGHLPVLAFHGPSTTANFTLNSSRIQAHIYSPAGFQSFPRLTISPNSPFYGVVAHLPREFQGDEVCRGLAFALFKYFSELPDAVKTYLRHQYPTTRGRRPGSAPALFGEQHAADLAKAMARADSNTPELLRVLHCALQTQHVSNIDLDLVLPPGTITPLLALDEGDGSLSAAAAAAVAVNTDNDDDDDDEDILLDPTLRQYDPAYTPLVKLFGEPVFLPTSKLRRAPSRPSSLSRRSKAFTRDQKVELRMQMGELVDTEERYVLKLNELVKHIAADFRHTASHGADGAAGGPSADDLDRLFPRSADRILQINTAFMQDLRRVMDDTEEDAVRDLEMPYTFGSASSRTMLVHGGAPAAAGGNALARIKDPSGALAMAKTFLEWFPKFTDCYQDYIRASQHFPHLLNRFLDSDASTFRERVVQTTGEQTLRSILIEPVQRLPRYSLFIDQIVGCLPLTHPALPLMLKARDIITNICSMDDPLENKPHVINRLRNLIECWPLDLEPQGRLVLAADYVELAAPYDADTHNISIPDRAGLFLLFSDCLVLVKKKGGTACSGRDLLREMERPSPAGLLVSMTNAAGGPGAYDFAFSGWHPLADVRFTESSDGHLVWMTSTQEMQGAHAGEYVASKAITARCFVLQEALEAKAARWSEDLVKARIEGRFAEAEREDPTWTLRSVRLPENNNLGLHAAIFQEAAEQLIEGRREPAPVRVVFDNHRGTKGAPVGHYGVEIVVEIRTDVVGRSSNGSSSRGSYGEGKRLIMNTMGLNGKRYTDDIAQEDFLPTLSRRIIQLMSNQHNPSNPKLVPALVSYHTKTLRSLNFNTRSEKTRSFLASSPVKMLSSFLGGSTNSNSGNNSTPTTAANTGSTTNVSDSVYGSLRLNRTQSNASRQLPDAASLNGSLRDRNGGAIATDAARPKNPLVHLEQTFTAYVAALQARKGRFVGRTLLSRGSGGGGSGGGGGAADELSVNLLYNKLNESPFDWEAASSDLPPEAVFAAFEKFARIAWRDQMGTIMTIQSLDALQERAARKVPGDFADFVNYLFADMAPQNRRAFTALIKLLADLLDGCHDDGDRGALTLAFAELLVAGSGSSAHNYINLLDRLVEDCDRIFDEIGFGSSLQVQLQLRGSAYESLSSTARSHKSATGSMTSNTSSLRRKFGLESLLRPNNNNSSSSGSSHNRGPPDNNSVVSGGAHTSGTSTSNNGDTEKQSMWRSLSKHHRHPATGESASLSKAASPHFVNRSRSIDMGHHSPVANGSVSKLLRRPASRDRPPIAGAFDEMMQQQQQQQQQQQHQLHHQQQRPTSSHRPTSAHRQLETIGEPADAEQLHAAAATTSKPAAEKSLKKNRRSSLSDLKDLMAATSLNDKETALPPVALRTTKSTSEKVNASPRAASPSKIPISPQALSQAQFQLQQLQPQPQSPLQQKQQQQQQQQSPQHRHKPRQNSQQIIFSSPRQKENIAIAADATTTPTAAASTAASFTIAPPPLAPSAAATANGVTADSPTKLGHTKTLSGSGIPTLKASRAAGTILPPPRGESPTRPGRLPPPASPTKLPAAAPSHGGIGTGTGQKLRLQSPQKLRERLQSEKNAVNDVDASLTAELARIAADMARLGGESSLTATAPPANAKDNSNNNREESPGPDVRRLAASVQALEARLPPLLQDVTARQVALQRDLDTTVRAAESKARAIDQLYREATAENELLYEKFNAELAKIVRALKGKGREDKETLVATLQAQSEETARLKKENARLRREAVSLRTLLKGGE